MKSCECKCTGFVDNPQVKKGRANPSMPKNRVSDKFINKLNGDEVPRPIFAKPEVITNFNSYLIDVV